jgi:hypothetical protein
MNLSPLARQRLGVRQSSGAVDAVQNSQSVRGLPQSGTCGVVHDFFVAERRL